MKSDKRIRLLAIGALFCALIFVATAFLPRLPVLGGSGGYVHFGDVFIFLAASLLPGPYPLLAAGIGASLADATTGFLIWAPASFFIKSFMTLFFSSASKHIICSRNILALVFSAAVSVGGYYIYEAAVISNFKVALVSIPFNLIQAALSSVIYLVLAAVFDKFKKFII